MSKVKAGDTGWYDKAVTELEKKFGPGALMKYDGKAVVPCAVYSSGAMALDIALGVGGIPRGRAIEVFGPESSGKTTLTLSFIREAQKAGAVCAFIDAEHAFDPQWARNIGVNVDELIISQPDTMEQALETVETLANTGQVGMIIVDSVAALIPKAELEGDMGESHMGLHARLMSQALRKLTGALSKKKCTAIFINQIREKIGQMFGNPETTPGGRALKFYSSVRLEVKRIGQVKDGEKVVGSSVRVKVVKNKVSPPFKEAELKIYFGDPVYGFDDDSSIFDMALAAGVITKKGSWFYYGSDQLGLGQLPCIDKIRTDKSLAGKIRQDTLAKTGSNVPVPAADADPGFDEDDAPDAEQAEAPAPAAPKETLEELG
jgi:recombination protein RecA